MKKSILLISTLLMLHKLPAQWKGNIEQYSYFSSSTAFSMQPVLSIQTGRGLYGEIRYNYEQADAASFNAGKLFFIPGKIETNFIPMLGIVAGSMKGINIALNQDTEWENVFVSARSQFCRSFSKEVPDFFYNWSEAGYTISEVVYTGIALQYTRQKGSSDVEPGLMAGINFKKFSASLYVFNPFCSHSYFVMGLNYEYNVKKRK